MLQEIFPKYMLRILHKNRPVQMLNLVSRIFSGNKWAAKHIRQHTAVTFSICGTYVIQEDTIAVKCEIKVLEGQLHFQRTACFHTAEERTLHNHRCKELKSYILCILLITLSN
jgi:hypothetical protein